jgi:ketosteroid isomerase-like protein
MKKFVLLFALCPCFLFVFSQKTRTEIYKQQIASTEKAFEKMASEKGIAEAFYFFADENAAILRENDSIIKGKENIKIFYDKKPKNASIDWSADFIEVSEDGTLGYTYGKFRWKTKKADGSTTEFKGIFHTVWKKQADNSWKYVWD